MSKIYLLIHLFLFSHIANAQVAHSVSYAIGITNTLYKSDIAKSKSYLSFFLPTTMIDYSKHNQNIFWGGIGLGFTMRQIPFHKYYTQDKNGIEAAEWWIRARAGLKFEGDYLTNLVFISLGVSTFSNFSIYSANNNGSNYFLNANDSIFKKINTKPFVEFGSKIINSTFTNDRKNVSVGLTLRYYPLPIFSSPIVHEYEYDKFKFLQYHLIELILTMGFQFNVQR